MKDKLLEVSNIECKYKNGKKVLAVEHFILNRGEVVFLLGPSGIGKSTFIEAIGLINNTGSKIDHSSSIEYFIKEKPVDLLDIWKKDLERLEEFRRNNFSFIFQNNYLMPNLTSGENMMMTLLMKGDSEKEATEKIMHFMNVVHLKEEVIKKSIHKLSGGQKQRLAFVRAIASHYEVLIGDEPTGNLDILTSDALLGFTRESIINEGKSGLFVSHDIRLALSYADRIYVFSPKMTSDGNYGVVSPSFLFEKKNNNWYQNDVLLKEPFSTLLSYYKEII
jgi:ABC-type lipoprotein export system ATPase subunit